MAAKNNKKEHNNSEDINISIDQARRFQIIEQCLKSGRQSLTELQVELETRGCNAASPSTVKHDIARMRQLGAPIKLIDKKFYVYDNENYTIKPLLTTILTPEECEEFAALMLFIKQIKNLPLFDSIQNLIESLLDRFNLDSEMFSYVGFDQQYVTGNNFFPFIMNHIMNKDKINITYKPFDDRLMTITMSPYYLKQFNQRWYVLGYSDNVPGLEGGHIINLALDRIQSTPVVVRNSPFVEKPKDLDFDTYFDDIYGVTHYEGAPIEDIKLRVDKSYLGYFETRPLHEKQIPR